MRFYGHKFGDRRRKTAFLWFPKVIGGEWRWLEETTWEMFYNCGWEGYRWISK